MKDCKSPDMIDEHLNECSKLLSEFGHANTGVLRLLSDDEKSADQTFWFKPKNDQFNKFINEAEERIYASQQQHQEEVSPDDSVSAVATPAEDESVFHVAQSTATVRSSRLSRSSRSSRSSGSSRFSISSIPQGERAQNAALLA